MSGNFNDNDSDVFSTPGHIRSLQGGVNLFSPTASEGTLERGISIHPGVVRREAHQPPYSNRRGQANHGSESTERPPPGFDVREHSGRRNTRPIPSTPPNQTDRGDSTDTRVVTPTTAALIEQLRAGREVTKEGADSPDSHPAIQVSHYLLNIML